MGGIVQKKRYTVYLAAVLLDNVATTEIITNTPSLPMLCRRRGKQNQALCSVPGGDDIKKLRVVCTETGKQ